MSATVPVLQRPRPDGVTASTDILDRINTIIAPWYELSGGGRPALLNDGIYYRLCTSDGQVLHEVDVEHLPDLLAWVEAVDTDIRGRCQAISGASTTKSNGRRRGRPIDPVVANRRDQITELAERLQPASVRQLYYQAETLELVSKTENGYRQVQHDILILRERGRIEYEWISDNTRWMRKSRSYRGIDHFLHLSIGTYRRDLWHGAPVHVEIWIEKDALAGTIMEETDPYDVPLMVARGFSSETYLYETAQAIAAKGKPAYIYAFFDHDPSGKHSAKHIERKLREFAPDAEIYFELVGVTEQQIKEWSLPTRETKREDNRHANNFEGDSCELDSIRPDLLRDLVRECIERHVDQDSLATLQAAEKSEREALEMFAQSWRAAP